MEHGRAICDIATLKGSLDEKCRTSGVIRIRLTALTSLVDEPLNVIVQMFSGELGKNYSVSKEIKFNSINIIPDEFSLSQNYPNPFNSSTVIHFTIPNETRVILKIFNMLGQEVETLIDKQLNPGEYNVNCDGAFLPSGLYFYQVKTNKYVDTKKLILLK
jgi:hypothetical protein